LRRCVINGIYFLIPTLIAVLVSFLVVRAAAIGLMLTGLDENRARFQALSAFSGTGFTTRESEAVINHPTRRRIIIWLMILGNAGVVTVIVTTTSSMLFSTGSGALLNGGLLLLGLFLIYKIMTWQKFITIWERFIESRLVKSPAFEEAPAEELLHLIEGYGLVKAPVGAGSEMAGKTLAGCRLTAKGLLVLGIEREGKWLPVPKATETIQVGDRLVVYGGLNLLRDLFALRK